MKHAKDNCTAQNIFISTHGLQCGNCLAIDWTPTLTELRQAREESINALVKECGIFFAFSDKQFDEGKTSLKEGDKYVSLGAGSFVAKSNADKYVSGIEKIMETFANAINENNLREEYVLYELNNHEASYTGNIDDTLGALIGNYTREEVQAVYNKMTKRLTL